MKLLRITFTLSLVLSMKLFAQEDDLFSMLDSLTPEYTDFVEATFKSTKIINGQSIERVQDGQLHFRIAHRFGALNTGWRELYGLDQATMYFTLEYGLSDRFMVGIGRATELKTYNSYIKYSMIRQTSGAKNIPVAISLLTNMTINSWEWSNDEKEKDFNGRINYIHQILIARKFNRKLSLQLTPTLVHRNMVPTKADPNDLYALGIGGRYLIKKRLSINGEYFWVLPPFDSSKEFNNNNNLSVGVDLETGGHIFQLHLTNSQSMVEPYFIGETRGKWLEGDIFFGFNLVRVFGLKHID